MACKLDGYLVAAALCLLSMLPCAAAQAIAQQAHASLRLEGGQGCLDAHELESAVEGLVERDAIVDRSAAKLELLIALSREAGRWRAQVTLLRQDGHVLGKRELVGAVDCQTLEGSLVVVVATLLDAAVPPAPLVHKPWVAVGAMGQVQTGILPAPVWSAHLFLKASLFPRTELWFDLGLGLPQRVPASAPGRSATFQSVEGRLALCPEGLGPPALKVFVCAGVMLGVMRGVGEGFDLLRATESRLRSAATLELALRIVPTRHVAVQVGAAPWLALSRPRFYSREGSGAQHLLSQSELVGGGIRIVFILGGQ